MNAVGTEWITPGLPSMLPMGVGYSQFSSYVGSGPVSTVHKKSGISSTPKDI